MVFPTISIAESFAHPTSMYLRNLMAMETEEMIRAQPMDSVVVIGGCDKNLPAQLMAIASVDLPAIVLPTGPMLVGHYKGETLGACTDCRRFWAQHRAGQIDVAETELISGRLCPTIGTCSSMGTASTIACLVEALGLSLPMSATAPAVSADRRRIAEATGRRAAQIAIAAAPTAISHPHPRLRPQRRHRPPGHRRIDQRPHPPHRHRRPRRRPLLARRLRPALPRSPRPPQPQTLRHPLHGRHLHHAGGLPALLRAAFPAPGHHPLPPSPASPSAQSIAAAESVPNQDVIRTLAHPLTTEGAMAILHGNLAPSSAVIKHSAASPHLMKHTGRAVVFDSLTDLAARIDQPDLDVTPDDILVLRNAGPRGAPGMPEAGYLPIPLKLARAGVKDMVRISDARMSGTAFGTIVLHIAPESAIGGPLAIVRTGDRIALDVEARRIDLLLSDTEIAARLAAWHTAQADPAPSTTHPTRGYARLFHDHILQAPEGCDFDFLLRTD
jgi:dihydroxy-acid dehydratase